MADQVELSVRSQLGKVIEELQKIKQASDHTSKSIKDAGKVVGKGIDDQVRKTEQGVTKTSSVMRRMLDTLKSDLKSLASINALQESLKLSNVFKGSISETLSLGDAIRRLGPTLGIASKDFASFQSRFVKGMGDIGLSSESAQKALEGLAETPVRGEANLLEYAKAAGQLAQISGQKGSEGGISKGMSGLIQARGGNVNDTGQMKAVAEDLRRVQNATGKGAQDTIAAMQELYTNMSADFRKSVSTRQLAQLAAGAQVAGPNATKFIEQYLKMSKTQRAGLEARGVGGLVGKDGLNTDNIKKFYEEAKRLGQGDIRLGLKAMGVDSDEAAEGFERLSEHLQEVQKAQDGVANATGNLNEQYRKSMGLADAFKASVNKIKGVFAPFIAGAQQKGADLLGKASEHPGTAAAVVGGGGLLAAMLAGGGIRGLLNMATGEAKGMAQKKAIEALTGEKVQDVYVINAKEIGGGGVENVAGSAIGAGAMLKNAGLVGLAGAAGVGVGLATNAVLDKTTQGTTSEGFEGNVVERLFFKLDKLIGGEASKGVMKSQKVIVELNNRQLKQSKQPTRGASQ